MLKRLGQPRQAQGEPIQKAGFALWRGLTCDLEGLGAEAGQRLVDKKFKR